MATKKKKKTSSVVTNSVQLDGSLFRSSSSASNSDIWLWGADNLFPVSLDILARSNSIHRGIMKSKAHYISGKGFAYDDNNVVLDNLVKRANGKQSLYEVVKNVIYDKVMTGNAFIEVAIAKGRLLLFHQDATRCRLSKPDAKGNGGDSVIISKDWLHHNKAYDKALPLFPTFEKDSEGVYRSIVHLSDYEPLFEHYGVPAYVAGIIDARIGSKTSNWNESRLDNSFQLSGVMEVQSSEDTDEELASLKNKIQSMYAGSSKAGKVLWMIANDAGGAKFTPISSSNEGDWANLHDISKSDLVTAHSWFVSLSGLDYTTGLSSDRVLNEYNIALSTIITPEQTAIIEALRGILNVVGIDGSSLEFVNKAPIVAKPLYMKVWEARKADGLDYDPDDEQQNIYLANITALNKV